VKKEKRRGKNEVMIILDYLKLIREWCELKIALWGKDSEILFKDGEIWWCSLGMNLGEDIFGKGPKFTRPVLVFRKFTSNSFLGLPLTSQEKKGSWYVDISFHDKKNWIFLNQARILDKKRLTVRIGTLGGEEFRKVKAAFISFYTSENSHPAKRRGSVGKPKLYI